MNTNTQAVLIVEDEADLREAIITALTYEGFTVLAASDGEEGLSIALDKKPGLILLDITMPKMDGLEVLRALRADEWGKEVQVVVMTASDDLGKVAEVVEAGGNEYIVKTDITLAGIVAKVKEKLGS